MTKKAAIVLLSGGLDSTVCLWWAKSKKYSKFTCLTFEYGSKEESVLKQAAKKIGELASVDEHTFIMLDFLKDFSKKTGSTLAQASSKELPKLTFKQLDDPLVSRKSAKAVWIPGRNLLFLSIAAAYAETLGNTVDIITGFNLEEGTTFPDNRKEFIDAFTQTASYGILNAKVRVICPLVGLNKAEIVQLGDKLHVPMHLSNSCYNPKGFDGSGKPIHCGSCESCLRRKRGFIESSINDLSAYELNSSNSK